MLGSSGSRGILMQVVYMGADPRKGICLQLPAVVQWWMSLKTSRTYTSSLSQEQIKHSPVVRERLLSSFECCQHV